MKELLTQDLLRELLHYTPDTGVFVWKAKPINTRINVGDEAGGIDARMGYIRIRVNGARYLAHRLAWLYTHGEFPADQIDHINGNRQDNRLANLRRATRTENNRNRALRRDNSSGFAGVSFDNQSKKWRAQCSLQGRRMRIGEYSTPEEASAAYEQFIATHWGDFKPHIVRKLNERLAPIVLTAAGLKTLMSNYPEASEEDFEPICAALIRHVQAAMQGVAQAA